MHVAGWHTRTRMHTCPHSRHKHVRAPGPRCHGTLPAVTVWSPHSTAQAPGARTGLGSHAPRSVVCHCPCGRRERECPASHRCRWEGDGQPDGPGHTPPNTGAPLRTGCSPPVCCSRQCRQLRSGDRWTPVLRGSGEGQQAPRRGPGSVLSTSRHCLCVCEPVCTRVCTWVCAYPHGGS